MTPNPRPEWRSFLRKFKQPTGCAFRNTKRELIHTKTQLKIACLSYVGGVQGNFTRYCDEGFILSKIEYVRCGSADQFLPNEINQRLENKRNAQNALSPIRVYAENVWKV